MKAINHIQKTAPGPPMAIAVATPAMFPVPIRPDMAIENAWNELTPLSDDFPLNNKLTIVLSNLTCTNRVRIEKYNPPIIQSATKKSLQIIFNKKSIRSEE